MRYLNKIVFLNSAHIPYAEVRLDGNVHFIGTQGVGKSTLLRALLFFYNADKLKLGIPKEKRSFDTFYFPYSNSYIVYEVMRENGAYCVVVLKSQGRVAFRFVDTPFENNWFINEQGEVYADWSRIREHIGKNHQVTSLVTGYETYRDIIFGNNRRRELLIYRKFAIVESAKYQNIPRTIQNVFLNSKLDADFIKDTIIRSMNDEEVSIDLTFYRSQIKEFEQEYNDVMLWFTKNRNGEIVIRKIADKVINSYRDLIYTHQQIDELRAELNYAEKCAIREIPKITEKITKTDAERERGLRLISELQQKYTKERDVLNIEIGGIEKELKKTHQQRQHYENMGIEEVIRRVVQEDSLNQELGRMQTMKSELTHAYQDILAKYRSLLNNLEVDFRLFENNKQALILEKKTDINRRQGDAMHTLRTEEGKVRQALDEKLETVNGNIRQLIEEQSQTKNRRLKISYEEPYKKEIVDCEESIGELQKRKLELDNQINKCQMDIGRLRQECGFLVDKLKLEIGKKIEDVRNEKSGIEEDLKTLNNLIDQSQDSFAEWLETHKPGWQDTIGKVADEENILYSNELNPHLKDHSETLFGISLDLSVVERNIRTPVELKQERQEKQNALQDCSNRLVHLTEELDAEVERLEKKYSKQIREIADKQHLLEAEHLQLPFKLKNIQVDLSSWITKREEWKRIRDEEIQENLNEIAHRLFQAEEGKNKLRNEYGKLLKNCQKNYKALISGLQAELNEYISIIASEVNFQKQQLDERRSEFLQDQEAELSGKGADTVTIRKYDERIEKIQAELTYIRENREHVAYYQKDKLELFDKEPLMRNQKKELEDKLDALNERYDLRREKLQYQQKNIEDELMQVKRELQLLEDGLSKVDAFRDDDTFCPSGMMEIGEKTTRKSCDMIVEDLKSLIVSTIKKTDEFKKGIVQFNGNFSAKNTFHFRKELFGEQDYYDFASNLCEFVDNDKISDYQKHISERYTDILRRISKEVGGLTQNEGMIRKTISDINDDFIKRNFAGVIKGIALRPLPSSDKLMQLLLEIKRFNDDNQHNMGEADLFSQASREDVNVSAVRYLLSFMKYLLEDTGRKQLALADTFKLEFRVKENDNDTGWVEKIANVGSDGTDILVKAMVNIMLINVFKEKVSHKFGDFKIHCMMDEIGKLHPNNVKGILDFANCRNILLVNSSPTTYNVKDYRYTYLLNKDSRSNTQIVPLITYNKV
ncbi:ATP-binding protein [Bacteroides sp.]